MALKTLSPSRASDFKQCPQLFKFRAVDRIPEPTTIYQARGTTAHLALQHLYDLPAERRTPEALHDLFRQAWTELRGQEEYRDLFDDAEAETAWGVESMKLLSNYFSIEDPQTTVPFERELDLTEDLDGLTIRGILDRIDERSNGDVVIIDYKTGRAPPPQFAQQAFFALKVYALLVRHRTGKTPVELQLIYLNGPTLYRLPVSSGQLDGMHKQIRALWNTIDSALETETFPPRPGKLCDWCSYRDICPAFNDSVTASG